MAQARLRDITDALPTIEEKCDAATLALQMWSPGDDFRDNLVMAVTLTIEEKSLKSSRKPHPSGRMPLKG